MERNFETVMIEQCAPVLAGLKPAGLFRYETSDCADLARRVRSWNEQLGEKGLCVRVLKGCVRTFVYTSDEVVQQEIALYKVTRSRSVERLVRQHNVRILEIDDDYIVVEKTGHKAETKELFRLLQPYGVQQFVRSGIVAIIKSRRELLNEYLEELERSRRQTNSNHF